MANYQHMTANLTEKLSEFTSRLNKFLKEEFEEKQKMRENVTGEACCVTGNYLFLTNTYMKSACPEGPRFHMTKLESELVSQKALNTRRRRHSVINILKRLHLSPLDTCDR